MDNLTTDPVVGEYMARAGKAEEGRYTLSVEELVWLVRHCARLGALWLRLLKDAQAALPAQDDGPVSELKDLLTNLIIMQTRLAGQEEGLDRLLRKGLEEAQLERVAVDELSLRSGIKGVVAAWVHMEAETGEND